jgi:hypothetical protein
MAYSTLVEEEVEKGDSLLAATTLSVGDLKYFESHRVQEKESRSTDQEA